MKLYIVFILLIPVTSRSTDFYIYYENSSCPMQEFMANSTDPKFEAEASRLENGVNNILLEKLGLYYVITLITFLPNCKSYVIVLHIPIPSSSPASPEIINETLQNPNNGSIFSEDFSKGTGHLSMKPVVVNTCKEDTDDPNVRYWPAVANVTVASPCDSGHFDPCFYSTRKCNPPTWDPPSACGFHTPSTPVPVSTPIPTLPDFNTDITLKNAEQIADSLNTYISKLFHDKKILSHEAALEIITLLNKLTQKLFLQKTPIKDTLLKTINLVLEQFIMISGDESFKGVLASRLLQAIQQIAHGVHVNNTFVFNSETFVMALLSLNYTEIRDIIISTNSTFHFITNETDVTLPKDSSDYIILPMREIISAMTPAQKEMLNRLSVIFIRGSNLFKTTFVDKGKHIKFYKAISDYVISVSFPGLKIKHLTRKIKIRFKHEHTNLNHIACGYWYSTIQDGFGVWRIDGCDVIFVNVSLATCGCNHLTAFSLVSNIYHKGPAGDGDPNLRESYIFLAGCASLALFLLLTLLWHCISGKLKSEITTQVLFHLWGALLGANLVYVLAAFFHAYEYPTACKVTAVILHYFQLSSFTWISVMEFYLYKALLSDIWSKFIVKMYPLGWGVPTFIVTATVLSTMMDSYGQTHDETLCWIKSGALRLAFWIPLLVILLINGCMFGRVLCLLNRFLSSGTRNTELENLAFHFKGVLGIQSFDCVSWVLAFFAVDYENYEMRVLFAMCNILQGIFIFTFYCLVKRDVRETCCMHLKHIKSHKCCTHHKKGSRPAKKD